MSNSSAFIVNDQVVYPTHGVGRVQSIEEQVIGGQSMRLIAIEFNKDRMVLRIPIDKAREFGLRKIASIEDMNAALEKIRSISSGRKLPWAKRVQEYKTKINSGNPLSVAEVINELKPSEDNDRQSHSEKEMFQSAFSRFVTEFAAVEKIEESEAVMRLEDIMKTAA